MAAVFLTIGTHEPFDRLVRAVDRWCEATNRGAEVFGQITDRPGYLPRAFDYVDRMPPADFRARCEGASLIVSHAGMGSIITALGFRKPILVLPRRGHLGETRNDHQYATVRRLQNRAGLYVAMTEDDVSSLMDRLAGGHENAPAEAIDPFAEQRLLAALRQEILR